MSPLLLTRSRTWQVRQVPAPCAKSRAASSVCAVLRIAPRRSAADRRAWTAAGPVDSSRARKAVPLPCEQTRNASTVSTPSGRASLTVPLALFRAVAGQDDVEVVTGRCAV